MTFIRWESQKMERDKVREKIWRNRSKRFGEKYMRLYGQGVIFSKPLQLSFVVSFLQKLLQFKPNYLVKFTIKISIYHVSLQLKISIINLHIHSTCITDFYFQIICSQHFWDFESVILWTAVSKLSYNFSNFMVVLTVAITVMDVKYF